MTTSQDFNRLHKQLAHMINFEVAIEKRLEVLTKEVAEYPEATVLFTGFLALSRKHRTALETRFKTLTGGEPLSYELAAFPTISGLQAEADYPVTSALQQVYTLFNQAIFGYSVLHPLATRFMDSIFSDEEGTSYYLTREHTQNYVQAIQHLSRLIHDVVLWELDNEGYECQCICPSCSVGICLCSMAGRTFLSQVWEEAGPIFDDEGIYVQQPKQKSAAVEAGLQRGDVILAADGQVINRWQDFQGVLRNAESGDEIQLRVLRDLDESQEFVLIRP